MNNKQVRKMKVAVGKLAHFLAAGLIALGLAACASDKPADTMTTVVLPPRPERLADRNPLERQLRTALDLAAQKRFAEAGRLLGTLQKEQRSGSEGSRALGCAQMIVALRAGDMATLRRIGDRIDSSFPDPYRVDHGCEEIVTLYRRLVNRPAPVNAPQRLRTWLDDRLGSVENPK